jgi:hypothetical protein
MSKEANLMSEFKEFKPSIVHQMHSMKESTKYLGTRQASSTYRQPNLYFQYT